jgi:hypothetical protein
MRIWREKSQVFAKSLQKSMPEIRKSCLTSDLQRLQIHGRFHFAFGRTASGRKYPPNPVVLTGCVRFVSAKNIHRMVRKNKQNDIGHAPVLVFGLTTSADRRGTNPVSVAAEIVKIQLC